MKKIWLVEFPTYQYNEDVKALASSNGLKVVDARFGASINPDEIEKSPPSLTVKGQKKRGRKPKVEAEAETEE